MTLGEYINNYRVAHSMSMEEFGNRAGISKQYVSILEQGTKGTIPSIRTYEKIANATGVSIDNLFGIVQGKVSLSAEQENKLREQEEVALLAEELHKDKDLRMLFDLAKDAKPEDLQFCADMLRRFKETNK